MPSSIAALPAHPPAITVATRGPSSDTECRQIMTINCTADLVENLFALPIIAWRNPSGGEVPVGGGSNPRVDPQTRQLIFSGINESNAGTYTCLAVLNIPEAQIVDHVDMDTIEVNLTQTVSKGMKTQCTCSPLIVLH